MSTLINEGILVGDELFFIPEGIVKLNEYVGVIDEPGHITPLEKTLLEAKQRFDLAYSSADAHGEIPERLDRMASVLYQEFYSVLDPEHMDEVVSLFEKNDPEFFLSDENRAELAEKRMERIAEQMKKKTQTTVIGKNGYKGPSI